MTIILSKPILYGGIQLEEGSQQSFPKDIESDLVTRKSAVYVVEPSISTSSPVTSDTDSTGVSRLSTGNFVQPDIEPKAALSSTVFMFRNPVTQATSLISDQREIYIPTEKSGVYLGAFFGKRIKTHTAETLTDMGLFRAGLHTWHGSLTKSGSWTNSPTGVSTGAFQATGAIYSQTAGDTCSGSVTGTAAGIRLFLTSNGGYAIVAIDGDYTRANKLPIFNKADYDAGRCRATDIGKRYYSSYSSAPTSDLICLANDLSAGTHTITVEATGTKPSASSGTRAWVEGFAGCNGETLGNANVYAVPVQWIYHDLLAWSAFDSVAQWAPSGSSDYQFLGNIHGDNTQSKEVTTSLSWTVGATDQTSLAAGTWASGQIIRCDHVSTLAHKVNTASTVATKTRHWTMAPSRKLPIMCDCGISWATAGAVNIEYPVMLPIGEVVGCAEGMKQDAFATVSIGHLDIPIPYAHDNAITYIATDTCRIVATGRKVKAWAELKAEIPYRGGLCASYQGAIQDRNTKDKKFYAISAFGPTPYASGDAQRFVMGWGAKLM